MTPCIKESSVNSFQDKENDELLYRMLVAKKQRSKKNVSVEIVIEYTKNFLSQIGIKYKESFDPKYTDVLQPREKDSPKRGKIKGRFYFNTSEKYRLNDKRDIIWMKFTQSGYLGVVAMGCDINLNYDNSSGIIINYLGEEWNEEFILIFPLPDIESPLTRSLIECGVGDYLISKGIPILDYFSHRY